MYISSGLFEFLIPYRLLIVKKGEFSSCTWNAVMVYCYFRAVDKCRIQIEVTCCIFE